MADSHSEQLPLFDVFGPEKGGSSELESGSPSPRQLKRRRRWPRRLAATAALLVVALLAWPTVVTKLGPLATKAGLPTTEAFPQVNTANLSPAQRRILEVTAHEYANPQPGTYYAQGSDEPWCSDFASWVMRSAGVPYKNPVSGSWRIPGTLTLRDYYRKTHRFHAADSGYQPVVGDTVMYDYPSPFGQHVNIVISTEGGKLVTIGGNELGIIRVRTHSAADDAVGLIGYGSLPT